MALIKRSHYELSSALVKLSLDYNPSPLGAQCRCIRKMVVSYAAMLLFSLSCL